MVSTLIDLRSDLTGCSLSLNAWHFVRLLLLSGWWGVTFLKLGILRALKVGVDSDFSPQLSLFWTAIVSLCSVAKLNGYCSVRGLNVPRIGWKSGRSRIFLLSALALNEDFGSSKFSFSSFGAGCDSMNSLNSVRSRLCTSGSLSIFYILFGSNSRALNWLCKSMSSSASPSID